MWQFLQEEQLKLLFVAFISPYLDYGALAWGGTAKKHIKKLERSLRKIIRLMMFKDKNHIAKPHYKKIFKNTSPGTKYETPTSEIHEKAHLKGTPENNM